MVCRKYAIMNTRPVIANVFESGVWLCINSGPMPNEPVIEIIMHIVKKENEKTTIGRFNLRVQKLLWDCSIGSVSLLFRGQVINCSINWDIAPSVTS